MKFETCGAEAKDNMWDDNNKIIKIFNEVENNKNSYPCICPVCSSQTAHIYVHKHSDRHCGIWVWCSSCGAYSHLSGETPKWWKNPDFIDSSQLCVEPEYLDQLKDKIDDWVNSVVSKANLETKNPFIMESRFEVILKEQLQDIPAGTTGTIVIKDNFKTMTIEFIGIDRKIFKINESPDNLLKIVEVIKPSNNNQS